MNEPRSRARRDLLKWAAATGMLAAVERSFALATTAPDYKALVCIFQQGGNDGENTLIRHDTAGYASYAAVRTPASGINIPRRDLLAIQPASSPTPFGFHPACAPLRDLFARRKLAVIANVGMLAAPSTREGLTTGGAQRPANLFSHSDQQRAVLSVDYTGVVQTGWGGRLADRLDTQNTGALFPAFVATGQWGVFGNGARSLPLTVPIGESMKTAHTSDPGMDALGDAAMREIAAQTRGNLYDNVAQVYAREGLATSSVVSPMLANDKSVVRAHFAGMTSAIALQLLTVALIIEGREQTGLRRQVFHVRQSNYDTHGSQPGAQRQLLGELAQAIMAFQNAMTALRLNEQVTTFTLSDFGRTFKPAAGKGTDHGWGNYAFVIGDAVAGGDIYGTLPQQVLNGPDDFSNAGRWIPTTSIEQYAATLVRWFGVPDADVPYVLPNIAAFDRRNLGFMRPQA